MLPRWQKGRVYLGVCVSACGVVCVCVCHVLAIHQHAPAPQEQPTHAPTPPHPFYQVSNAKLDTWGQLHGTPKIIVATGAAALLVAAFVLCWPRSLLPPVGGRPGGREAPSAASLPLLNMCACGNPPTHHPPSLTSAPHRFHRQERGGPGDDAEAQRLRLLRHHPGGPVPGGHALLLTALFSTLLVCAYVVVSDHSASMLGLFRVGVVMALAPSS